MCLQRCHTHTHTYACCQFCGLGRRPNETAATLVVGHVGARSHPSTDAQQFARRDDAAQRPKIRSAQFGAVGRAGPGRPLQRHHRQTARTKIRRQRLHLY